MGLSHIQPSLSNQTGLIDAPAANCKKPEAPDKTAAIVSVLFGYLPDTGLIATQPAVLSGGF
ncbi:MAG: hypothetical protein ACPG7F_20995 [Aggregatilineales bacterium]